MLLDERGHLATVVVTGENRSPAACYDFCPLQWTAARYVRPPPRTSSGPIVAVGPLGVSEDPARARMHLDGDAASPDERGWRRILWIDLDGDDEAEVELR